MPVVGHIHGARELGAPAIGVIQTCHQAHVHARRRPTGVSPHTLRRNTHDQAYEAQGIAAGIEQCATSQGRLQADIAHRVGHGEAKARLHRPHLADLTPRQQRQHGAGLGLKVVGKGLQQHHPVLACCIKHRLRLRQAQRQRLLAQHMLARLRSLDHPFCVQAVGQGQVDRIKLCISQQGFVAAVPAPNAAGLGKRHGGLAAPACHGIHADPGARGHITGKLPGNIGASQNAQTQGTGRQRGAGHGVGYLVKDMGPGDSIHKHRSGPRTERQLTRQPSNHPPLGSAALGAKPWQGRPSICMTCIDGSIRVLKPRSLQL